MVTTRKLRFRWAGATTLFLVLSHAVGAQELPLAGAHDAPQTAQSLPVGAAELRSARAHTLGAPGAPLPGITDNARTPWITRPERWTAGGFAGATILALPFDGVLARSLERPWVHRDPGVARGANVVRWLGDPGAVVLTAGSYAVGRVAGHTAMADAGLHATQAIIAAGATTNLLKLAIGRARPRAVSGRDPFSFRPGRGANDFASFPSGHTTAAFAAASAIAAELRCSGYSGRHPTLMHAAPAVLFGVAALVGVSRMYHDAHWASDVIAGGGIGTISGQVLVRRGHTGTARNWLDRRLLSASDGVSTSCRRPKG